MIRDSAGTRTGLATSTTSAAESVSSTLATLGTDRRSTTLERPVVFSTSSSAQSLAPSFLTEPLRTTAPPGWTSTFTVAPSSFLSNSIRCVTRWSTSFS